MITKVRFQSCPECKDGIEKATISGRCLYHYRKWRNELQKQVKLKRKLSPPPVPKVKNTIKKQDDYNKVLEMWYKYFMVNAKKECENCEISLAHYNEADWLSSQHHILEKSIFPSVAGNLNNHMVLGKWCCHGQWHSSFHNANKMTCFGLAKLRVKKLIPFLQPEELNKLNDAYK